MTLQDFAKLVQAMRAEQVPFFKRRHKTEQERRDCIERSKVLEKQVDRAVREILDPPTLPGFGGGEGG